MISALALAATAVFAQEKAAAPAKAGEPASKQTAKAEELNPVVMSATGVSVTKEEFEQAIKTLPPEYQQYATGSGKKQFAEDYLKMKVLAAEGMKDGLDKKPSVRQQLDLMRQNLVATEEVHKLESTIKVSDADVQKYYEEHKNEYEQVKARHILIAPKDSPAAPKGEGKKQLTDAEAKAKADEIRAKLVAGADFAEVAKKESDDTGSGAQGGELGSFGRGQMVPEFEQAAFAAKAGEITQPIKTQFGYHIIKVESHDTTPLAEVREALEKEEKQKLLQAKIDEIKTKANPTFNESYFGKDAAPAAASAKSDEPKKQ